MKIKRLWGKKPGMFLIAAVLIRLCLISEPVRSQNIHPLDKKIDYAVDKIPPELLKGVNSVVRYDAEEFDVKNKGKAVDRVRYAVTILNANAKDEGVLVDNYDKFLKIRRISGKIYDANGKVIRKLRKSDTKDYAADEGISLYQDDRIRVATLYNDNYPYTVEYDYEIEYNGLINWPEWQPMGTNQSVQSSVFQVDVAPGIHMRYKEVGLTVKPRIMKDGSDVTYQWKLTDQGKRDVEDNGPPDYLQLPHLLTAPDAFEIANTQGNMGTWKSFGAWYEKLIQGKQSLPQKIVQKVKSLVAGVSDPAKKADILYHYMQSNTHYVSVQLGIGGWEPYDATYVAQHGYGDCKALVNYMMSLLKVANITSYPALVSSGVGAPDIHTRFPFNQFDHVILCVPIKEDTVWLECTGQTLPFNELGDFTSNRHVLLITPNGGKLVKTPASKADDNQEIRFANVSLEASGDAKAVVTTMFSGDQKLDFSGIIKSSTADQQKQWLHERIDIPNFNLDGYHIKWWKKDQDTTQLTMKLSLPGYGGVMGNRIFITPNLMNKTSYIPPATKKRKYPVYFNHPYFDTDSVLINIPKGYRVEALPDSVEMKESFGSYKSCSTLHNDGRILYIRHMKIDTYRLPAKDYHSYRKFLSKIVDADKSIIAIVKK